MTKAIWAKKAPNLRHKCSRERMERREGVFRTTEHRLLGRGKKDDRKRKVQLTEGRIQNYSERKKKKERCFTIWKKDGKV